MKKTLLGLIAVLLLGVGAYFTLQDENEKTTLDVDETDFSVTDTSQITRFFIAKKNGSNYHFKRQADGEWIVNDSWQAEKGMVEMVLGTIHEMKVKAPVPKAMRNGVIKTLAGEGVKVELYNKDGLMKTFFVGDYTADEKGTYFIMKGSENPYVIHIPRFNGFLTGRFMVNKEDFIDRILFQSHPTQIESLEIRYPSGEQTGFMITNNNVVELDEIDSLKFKQYISQFASIHAEQFAKVNDRMYVDDSLAKVTPYAIVDLKDQDVNKSRKLTLYKNDDPERMLAYVAPLNIYVWVQYFVFDKLLIDRSDFIKKKPKL